MGIFNLLKKRLDYNSTLNNILKENELFLTSGVYKLHVSNRFIYNKKLEGTKKISEFSHLYLSNLSYSDIELIKMKIGLVLYHSLNYHRYITGKKKYFNGDMILFTSNCKETKIFNFSEEKILIRFSDKVRFEKYIKHYQYFSEYFMLPPILCTQITPLIVVEKYIQTSIEFDSKKLIEYIFEIYKTYFKAYSISTASRVQGFPVLLLHGDLWKANCVISLDGIYFIDWEHAGKYFFLYDIFMFMFNEFIINNDTLLLDFYFAGEYDHYLSDIFIIFDLDYFSYSKQDLFNKFIKEYISKRGEEVIPLIDKCMDHFNLRRINN